MALFHIGIPIFFAISFTKCAVSFCRLIRVAIAFTIGLVFAGTVKNAAVLSSIGGIASSRRKIDFSTRVYNYH